MKSLQQFHLPSSLAFDRQGYVYVAETGLSFDGSPANGKVWRIALNQIETENWQCIAEHLRAPLNGLSISENTLFIAEGGNPGRISALDIDTLNRRTVLDDLPGGGNYHTNMALMGQDGWLYFGQGAMTNSGIVGPDASLVSWLRQYPHPQDRPGVDIELSGWNAHVRATLNEKEGERDYFTGAFLPFGEASKKGQYIKAQLPCTSAVMRCQPDGSQLELVAWGLRNPYGLGVDEKGRLLAIDLGINERGSRPVGHVPDCLFEIESGCWYGWPDYAGGLSVKDTRYHPVQGEAPEYLLANHSVLGEPVQPLFSFMEHAAPTKFAFDPDNSDLLWIAFFGDKLPMTGPAGPRAGRNVICLNRRTGETKKLVADGTTLLEFHRPIDLAFSPEGDLHILDFGPFELSPTTAVNFERNGGRLLKVTDPVLESVDILMV